MYISKGIGLQFRLLPKSTPTTPETFFTTHIRNAELEWFTGHSNMSRKRAVKDAEEAWDSKLRSSSSRAL